MNPTINGPRHDRSTTTATLHAPGADWDASFDEPLAVGRTAAPDGTAVTR
jgi:hypothetical protein